MRLLLTFLLLSSLTAVAGAADEQYIHEKDVQTLLKTAYFGFGPIGMTPNVTEGEAALKRILKLDDAINYLFPVFEHGTLEGKCYALVGFRLLAPKHFEASCERLGRWNDSKVKTASGCIIGESKLGDVVQKIRAGEYDQILTIGGQVVQ